MSPASERAPSPASSACSFRPLQRHPRTRFVVEVGRAVDGSCAEPALDEERAAIGNGIGAGLGAPEIGHGLGGNGPGALSLPPDPERDDGSDPRHEVARPVSRRCNPLDRFEIGDPRGQGALSQAVVQDRPFGLGRCLLLPHRAATFCASMLSRRLSTRSSRMTMTRRPSSRRVTGASSLRFPSRRSPIS